MKKKLLPSLPAFPSPSSPLAFADLNTALSVLRSPDIILIIIIIIIFIIIVIILIIILKKYY